MFHYRVFGMLVGSDIRFPELAAAEPGPPDLLIRRRDIARPWPESGPWQVFDFESEELYLCFVGFSRYLVRNGSEIDVEVAPGFREDLVGFQMLGPVMAALLHQRGLLTLHGSAVKLGTRSAIFLGHKGAGKSTTAASMAAAGHALITDDVVAISDENELFPAYPTIKLTDAALEDIGLNKFEIIPTDVEGVDKQRARLRQDFSTEIVQPYQVFILERGEKAFYEDMNPLESLRALLNFSYTTRFGNLLIHGEAAAHHLRQCSRLANSVRVGRLTVPAGISRLTEAVALVEELVSV